MSFDVWMAYGDPDLPGNLTYNLGGMLALAFGRADYDSGDALVVLGLKRDGEGKRFEPTMKWVEGMVGFELEPLVADAIARMTGPAEKACRSASPENGWGDYDCCLEWLRDLQRACQLHPRSEVCWSG